MVNGGKEMNGDNVRGVKTNIEWRVVIWVVKGNGEDDKGGNKGYKEKW